MRNSFLHAGVLIVMLLLVVISLPPTGHSLKLAALGDIMLGRGVASSHTGGSWDQALPALAPHTVTADLTFANLESPITDESLIQDTYDLRAPNQANLALSAAGIDLLSLANNHIGDSGPSGLTDTIEALHSVGATPIGPGELPVITHSGGMDLAWFAFDDILQPLDEKSLHMALLEVRQEVDLVIVSIHWGSEGQSWPNDRQRSLAKELATVGADIILGHHPHVLQPTEWVWGEGRGRSTFVAYSLGNTLFDQGAPPTARQSALLMLTLSPLGVMDACAIPFQIDPESWNVVHASPTAAKSVLDSLRLGPCPDIVMNK